MSALEDTRLAFIGAGVMGEAMIKGLLSQRLVLPEMIVASDPRPERGTELSERYGISATTDNVEAAQQAQVVVLSIKPQVLTPVLAQLRGHIRNEALVLSIIAGARIETIARGLEHRKIVRVMPNTPAQIGQGMSVWISTSEVGPRQREQAQMILRALGEEIAVDDEDYLDMATALSGTGPAYVFLFMEALIDAGVHLGFSRRVAQQLVLQTLQGSVAYARQSNLHPAELRNQVTSPGGTSAEALYQLEKGGLRTVLSRAIWAAYQKSRYLGGLNNE
ncbi:MAG: pyrroline-5-carboxylate reductase [Anaerolineae bacterium]|nr:pyrroline-5-carboxylate reductase [Anaerolineae bacterium]